MKKIDPTYLNWFVRSSTCECAEVAAGLRAAGHRTGFSADLSYYEAEAGLMLLKHGDIIMAPVAYCEEAEVPGETKPVEPKVGLSWKTGRGAELVILAVYTDSRGCVTVAYEVINSEVSTRGYTSSVLAEDIKSWRDYPTVTTPATKVKRLVRLEPQS